MIDPAFATWFAEEWIAAWNAHDLAKIPAHYADDFEPSAPFIAIMTGVPRGTLQGNAAVGAYWQKALQKIPYLHFELIEVCNRRGFGLHRLQVRLGPPCGGVVSLRRRRPGRKAGAYHNRFPAQRRHPSPW